MCELISDVISCSVSSCDTGINVYDKIVIINQKKEKILKSKQFYVNIDLKDGLRMEFTVC